MWRQNIHIFISPVQIKARLSQAKPLPPLFHMDESSFCENHMLLVYTGVDRSVYLIN